MESELVTVRRINLRQADLEDATKTYIEAYHVNFSCSKVLERQDKKVNVLFTNWTG